MDIVQVGLGVGLIVEMVLVAILLRRRAYRTLPAFLLYVCWGLCSDVVLTSVRGNALTYFHLYLIQLMLDSVLLFAVLVELAWNLLRPIRTSLPKRSWMVIAMLIALAGLLVWPLAGFAVPANLNPAGMFFFRLQQTFAILRVVTFLALAGFSHLLSIGWRDRELQVATGLGVYSLVSLTATVLHTHQIVGPQYHWLDLLVSACYLIVLSYWAVCFATRETERQEFTPRMRDLLLAAAGAARSTRVSLMESRGDQPKSRTRR